MRGELARGALPEPGFYSLSGLEQAHAIRRRLVPRSPLAHLTGLTVTQVGPGTATLTAPASPWLDAGEGLQLQSLAEAALATAVLTSAPGGMQVRTGALSFSQFRPATLDADKFIAHARTIRDASTFTYAQTVVEDDLGREIGQVGGAVVVRRREPPPPACMPLERPFEEPSYPTPDPYLRPLPPGVGPIPQQDWEELDGLALMQKYFGGETTVPIEVLLGVRGVEVDRGVVRIAMNASDWFCLRDREVAPGVIATFMRVALTAASYTRAGRQSRVAIINLSSRFLRPVVPDGRELIAEVDHIDHHEDTVVASVTVANADGERVASAYQTSVLLPIRPRPERHAEPVMATVVFTDLVGSTALASELGDDQWRHLLAEHEAIVRRQLGVFRGREIKTTGDGFLAIFDSPARAVRCAHAIGDATRPLGIEVRAGIHTGECEVARGDITGIAVHFAARVLAVAEAGEIMVSSTVRDLLLGSGLRFEERGHHKLKGIEGEWALFALSDQTPAAAQP